MSKRDYYDVLGVERDADEKAIKAAFRKKAMQFHPDRNPDDKDSEKKFKEVNEAYECLKDGQKRAAYDRFGHAAFEGGGPRPGGGQGGFGAQDFNFGASFSDIFDEMFGDLAGARGGGRAQGGAARGADMRYNLDISLEEAFSGVKKAIKVPGWSACGDCDGSGAAKGSSPITCPACNGAGRVRAQQGFFTIERTCTSCQGAGRIIQRPCESCAGAGRIRKEKTLQVNIPAGVEDGTRIRLAGEGDAGVRGAPPGDLYVFLSVTPHRFFQRDGADLKTRIPIAMTVAALGGEIEVPTIEGKRSRLKIPVGTQPGQSFRLKGKGMSVLRASGRGDLYVEIQVETPVNLNRRQQDLLRDFAKAGKAETTSPQSESFLAKVKDLWDDLTD